MGRAGEVGGGLRARRSSGPAVRRGVLALAAAVALAVPGGSPIGAAEPRPLTLEESLRLAAERSLRVRSARQEAAELAEEVPKAYKEFFPKLRGEARYYLQAPRPQIINPAGSTPVPPLGGVRFPLQDVEIVAGQRTDYNLRLRLEQPLFTGFRLSSAYAAARLDEEIGSARLARAKQAVAEDVKVAYFAALKAHEQQQAAEAHGRLRAAEIRHTEGLIAGGRATATDLPPLRAALAGAQQEAFEASQRYNVVIEDLKRLTGVDPSEEVRPTHPPEERVLTMEVDEAVRMARDQRPELRELALATDRAKEGITQARSGYYPRVGLFGLFDKQRQTILNPRGEFVAGGIEVSWTLWEWRRTNHEVSQAELRHERALTELRDRQAAIGQEARAAFAEMRVAERRPTALREEVEAARNAARVAEERLRGGVGVVRDVTVARLELVRALARYRAAVYDGDVARAHLARTIGVAEVPTAPGAPPLTADLGQDFSTVELASLAPATRPPEAAAASAPPVPATPEEGKQTSASDGKSPVTPPAEAPPPPAAPGPSAPSAPAAAAPSGPPAGASAPAMAGAAQEAPFPPPPARPQASFHWLDEPAVAKGRRGFSIGLASFGEREAAHRLARRLEAMGFGPLEVTAAGAEGQGKYRAVLVGLRTQQTAERAARDARRVVEASEGPGSLRPGGGIDPPAPGSSRDGASAAPAAGVPTAVDPAGGSGSRLGAFPVGSPGTETASTGPGAPAAPPQGTPPAGRPQGAVGDREVRGKGAQGDGPSRPVPSARGSEKGRGTGGRDPEPPVGSATPGSREHHGFQAEVGTFTSLDEARRVAGLLESRGYGPVQLVPTEPAVRVLLVGFSSPETAERAARDARRELGASRRGSPDKARHRSSLSPIVVDAASSDPTSSP